MRIKSNIINIELEDESPISFLNETLDKRVRFSCNSEHAYYDINGFIKYATINEYPLEYVSGIPIGRHEPEPERFNFILDNNITSTGYWTREGNATVAIADQNYIIDPTGTLTTKSLYVSSLLSGNGTFVQNSPFSTYFNIQPLNTKFSITAWVKSEEAITEITIRNTNQNARSEMSSNWEKIGFKYTKTNSINNPAFLYSILRSSNIDITNFYMWGAQVEIGENSTSPIRYATSVISRERSYVYIKTQSAIGCKVLFSNGDEEIHNFDGISSEFSLPTSTHDWGSRYIQRIEYILPTR